MAFTIYSHLGASCATLIEMPLDHVLTDDFSIEVERLFKDPTISDTTLHNQAQEFFQVYNEPSLSEVEVPPWVRRIQPHSPWEFKYTSRRLFESMYEVSDMLQLPIGRRYLSAAICACASHAGNAPTCSREQSKSVAEALARLASLWIAFMLWPCK